MMEMPPAPLHRRHTLNAPYYPQPPEIPTGATCDLAPAESSRYRRVGGIDGADKRRKSTKEKLWTCSIWCSVVCTFAVVLLLVAALRVTTKNSQMFLSKWHSTYDAYHKQHEALQQSGVKVSQMEKMKMTCEERLGETFRDLTDAKNRELHMTTALADLESVEDQLKKKDAHLEDVVQAFRNQYYELVQLKEKLRDCERDRQGGDDVQAAQQQQYEKHEMYSSPAAAENEARARTGMQAPVKNDGRADDTPVETHAREAQRPRTKSHFDTALGM